MEKPTEEDIDRCVSAAFDGVQKDVTFWNTKIAGRRKYSWSKPGDVHKPIKFSHREWCIGTLYELLNKGFTIDATILLQVQRSTHCTRMDAD